MIVEDSAPSPKRPGYVGLLMGLVLLVTAAGILAVLPVIPCPLCKDAAAQMGHDNHWKPGMWEPSPYCGYCLNQKKFSPVELFVKWVRTDPRPKLVWSTRGATP
jgi:hypothetical protein